jgi:Ni,Fe-hydrogenase I cytochrome b subunit
MTVRDLANEIMDMQVWEALLLWFVVIFVGSFANAAVRDFTKSVLSRRGRKA